VIKINIGH